MTHGVHWLPHVDHIVVLAYGEIIGSGSYDELRDMDFLKCHGNGDDATRQLNEDASGDKGEREGGLVNKEMLVITSVTLCELFTLAS